ncbi:MAG: PfkB family carbohydrate kinase, partial [Jannaschia helgolandensis]
PAPRIASVDTLGAGDVWHGAFTLALARGRDLTAASTFANHVAATKCTRAGGWDQYPTHIELETE